MPISLLSGRKTVVTSFLPMENQAARGRATGSRGRGRHQAQNPDHNRNFWQNSGQNRQWEARSFHDAAAPHSAAPRRNGCDGGRGPGGRGGGRRDGPHYSARQPSSDPAALATTGALGLASPPAMNSFTMRTVSTTSVTHSPGEPNGYRCSHQYSVLISWPMGLAVCRLQYVLATFVGIIIFFISRIG